MASLLIFFACLVLICVPFSMFPYCFGILSRIRAPTMPDRDHCLLIYLTHKERNKNAADDILFFYFYLSKKIRLDVSSESSA